MTEYVLDVSKWRCGMNGQHKLGFGETRLINDYGFSCCLGQFALQKGIPQSSLLHLGEPSEVCELVGVYDKDFAYKNDDGFYRNTDLSVCLIDINDNAHSTKEYKIDRIRERLEAHGHTLKVVNDNDKANT